MYYELTDAIESLGDLMNTGADSGTGGNGWENGLSDWLVGHPLVVVRKSKKADYWPQLSDLAKTAAAGGLVSFAYGRYENETVLLDMPMLTSRNKGHAVTLIRAHADGPSDIELWSRDPGSSDDDGDLFGQSPYTYRIYSNVETMTVMDGMNEYDLREVTTLNYPSNDGRISIIDSYVAIYPFFGMSFDTVQVNFEDFGANSFSVSRRNSFPAPTGASIVDAVLHPELHSFLALYRYSDENRVELATIDRGNGNNTRVARLPGTARKLTTGRDGDAYVLEDDGVRKVMLDGESQPIWVPIAGGGEAIAYDDESDEVLVVSTRHGRLHHLPCAFDGRETPLRTDKLPADLPISDEADVAIDPVTRQVWLVLPGDNTLYSLKPLSEGRVVVQRFADPRVNTPTAVEFDDDGNLLVVSGDVVLTFARGAKGTGWRFVPALGPNKLSAPENFRIARSRTNYDPRYHDGPEWYNIDPKELLPLGPLGYDGYGYEK